MYNDYIELVIEEAERAIDACEYRQAERMLLSALHEEPGYAKLHFNLGWLYESELEEFELAAIHYWHATRFDPSMSQAWWYLIDLLINEKRYKELLVVIQEGLKIEEVKKCNLYNGLGIYHESQKEYSKALSNYKNALLETVDEYQTSSLNKSIKRVRNKRIKTIWKWQQKQ